MTVVGAVAQDEIVSTYDDGDFEEGGFEMLLSATSQSMRGMIER